jgi:hypothetical protein
MRQSKIEKERNPISMNREISELRTLFDTVEDKRAKNTSHKLSDIFMSGFAMFSLKHGSLLEFNQ